MGGGDWPPPARRQVRHGHLFFSEDGALLRSIHETRTRWAKTLARLPIRSRRPYCARHSSVSWKQHGHSVRTMLEVYAPWADGAVESDVTARRRSIDLPICEASRPARTSAAACAATIPGDSRGTAAGPEVQRLALDLAPGARGCT